MLKEKSQELSADYPELDRLIDNMWETMQNANGSGLAAPQVGVPIRLFIVDSKSTFESLDESDRATYYQSEDRGIKEAFINARITKRSEQYWEDEEGCLSIPGLSQPVRRPWSITVEYYNSDFIKQTQTFSGTTARIIQHEYDHVEGILYIDHLKPITKRLIQSRLKRIINGRVETNYPMNFPKGNRS
ncbi:peptide deformylase [Prolixibacter sp. NT017]|nr:peptide deformylase [Prolixibacter sp. NT017]